MLKELGKGCSPDEAAKASAGTFFPHIAMSAVIANLFNNTNTIALVSSALGTACKRMWGGQIALRFPGENLTLCFYSFFLFLFRSLSLSLSFSFFLFPEFLIFVFRDPLH